MKNNEYIEISRDIENLLKSESTHTFLILIDILLRSNNETNSLKTSISKIARTFGLDEREVKKSLSRLRKKELIEIYKNQDDKNSLIIALRKDNECYRITSKEFVMDETMIATLSIGRNDKGYINGFYLISRKPDTVSITPLIDGLKNTDFQVTVVDSALIAIKTQSATDMRVIYMK